ncbi:hypothetical protein IWX90DRAFT_389979 [Phyllosticta citrichinensis]|uniref:Uncharacterized protein n=1 Tax=Phyllosticta citrichinensis TaxID=1130410 RepID=A0ABR1XLU9_9PEZI
MLVLSSALLLLSAAQSSLAALTTSNLNKHVDVLTLDNAFNPVEEAYWTGLPHHRRTPFAVSPDGKSAYLAYLDSSGTNVHVQEVNPSTFAATGTTVTVTGGKEAGGLVAHNDGFALLTNEVMPSSTSGETPPSDTPVAVLYRYTSGKQSWKTWLGGPGVHANDGMGLSASPDINGDLVYSEEAGYYGAYIVVTDYTGDASGHYGDSILYVTKEGKLDESVEGTSSWGCSHNTGIAFEAADATPYASVCATDQGFLALNSGGTGMDTTQATKISNENVTNGATNEAFGGMSGSFSGLARFGSSTKYILTWVSRGATDLTAYDWMGDGYVSSVNRTVSRKVAIALLSDKKTLNGKAATSEVGATSGDSQINWIVPTSNANDCSNAHVATFGESNALLTWEEASNPQCNFIAMGCTGTFEGTKFQEVDSTGATVGDAITVKDTYVAGDMVTMSDGRICWPYVSMTWDLSDSVMALGLSSKTTKKISFACMSSSSSSSSSSNSTAGASSASSSSAAVASSTTVALAVASSAAATTPSVASPTTLQTLIGSSASAAQQGANGASIAIASPAATTPSESVAAGASNSDDWWYGSWPTAIPAQAGKTRSGKTCRRRKRGVAHVEA